jgi:hypothetical protein
MKIIKITCLCIALFCVACNTNSKNNVNEKQSAKTETVEEKKPLTNDEIILHAKSILQLFQEKKYEQLSDFVSPNGVRFSPYAYIDTVKDVVLSAKQISDAALSKKVFVWGKQDGSGFPIKLKIKDYFSEYVITMDFMNSTSIKFNGISTSGNSINNIKEAYSDCVWVEFYFEGTEEFSNFDWQALRLIFKYFNGDLLLVGVQHDQWTI